MFPVDFVLSALAGLIFSLFVVYFGNSPSLFKQDDNFSDSNENKTDSIKSTMQEDSPKLATINKQYTSAKLSNLQKILALSDSQMDDAINKTNKELLQQGSTPTETMCDEGFNYSEMLDTVFFLFSIILGFFAINTLTYGEFGRVLVGLFPTEVDSLNIRNYLEKYHILK